MTTIYNFSAGPAVLPRAVLEQARDELLDWHGTGMSVMEMSHRSKEYLSIAEQAEADLRELLAIPDKRPLPRPGVSVRSMWSPLQKTDTSPPFQRLTPGS
jgi:hypothetical protein